jgi:hypothetical protein
MRVFGLSGVNSALSLMPVGDLEIAMSLMSAMVIANGTRPARRSTDADPASTRNEQLPCLLQSQRLLAFPVIGCCMLYCRYIGLDVKRDDAHCTFDP